MKSISSGRTRRRQKKTKEQRRKTRKNEKAYSLTA